MAFHINLKESQKESGAVLASLFGGCSFIFDDGKPFLSCELSDSVKVDIDLTCSICLVSKLKMTSKNLNVKNKLLVSAYNDKVLGL